jgi:hypothetical protein
MTLRQVDLVIMHDEAMDKIQMYASGLITLLELQRALSGFDLTYDKVFGLVDPASGLRYQYQG